ncbi:nitroreductase family protein [Mariniplasma anaerobium]|uniref:Nitroreductase n=1 Tax=Mariniplasma anaerobium TaxID=2735436 RepID=A0A7U9THB6_9MOLU|nr:nitroreductase family protein [Mariniplasma anaerobium]BCR35235.1 nitroreductase [Mariniplasma anaerobium]
MIDSILKRKSIRTFDKQLLSEKDRNLVKEITARMKNDVGPFGNSVKWFVFDVEQYEKEKAVKLGTYGTVKNGQFFFGGIIKNTFEAMMDYGYLFEKIILELTHHNLGTLWIGGMFNRNALDEMILPGEIVPAISPVGYTSEYRSLRDRLTRTAIKGNQRKAFSTLFFDNDLDHPLDESKNLLPLAKYLKLVQVAPSASNKQPWRVVLNDNQADFYLERTPNYAKSLGFDIQAIDMGIALCHFCIGLDEDYVSYEITNNKATYIADSFQFIAGVLTK